MCTCSRRADLCSVRYGDSDLEPPVCSDSTSEPESEQEESTSSCSVVSLLTKLRAPRKSKLVTLCKVLALNIRP